MQPVALSKYVLVSSHISVHIEYPRTVIGNNNFHVCSHFTQLVVLLLNITCATKKNFPNMTLKVFKFCVLTTV